MPAGYKVIGCGAQAHYKNYGSLLTAVFPTDKNTCVARAKDHMEIFPDPSVLDVWAVGLHDPGNMWDVHIWRNTSEVSSHPEMRASVPAEYVMTGGGAEVHWAGAGNLLTASYPLSENTWQAESKDHLRGDPAAITVSAIGIRPRDKSLPLPRIRHWVESSAKVSQPGHNVVLNSGYVMASGGAKVNWRGQGSLLTASYPSAEGNAWLGFGKDHGAPDPATITVYLIGIAKPNAPLFEPAALEAFKAQGR